MAIALRKGVESLGAGLRVNGLNRDGFPHYEFF
jgi:hypothetical protein